MKKILCTLILIFVCIDVLASVQDEPQTNLDVLESIYASLFRNAIAHLSLIDSAVSVRVNGVDGGYNWLLEAKLLDALRSSGIQKTILHSLPNVCDSLEEIACQPISKKIVYSKVDSKIITRTIKVELHVRVKNNHDELLFSKILTETRADTLPRRKISTIENPDLDFTHGEMKESFWSKTAQPIVVSLITGFIIYLFYSYRSK